MEERRDDILYPIRHEYRVESIEKLHQVVVQLNEYRLRKAFVDYYPYDECIMSNP